MVAWLKQAHAVAHRWQDPTLSALMATLLILIFVAEPLAFKGITYPLGVIGIIAVGLILMLVLGSHQRGAAVVIAIGSARLLAGGLDFLWHTSLTQVVEAISTVFTLLAVIWALLEILLGPGHITWHRVRGAIVLYLTIAILFAWLYMLVAEFVPRAFSGLAFGPTHGALSPFLYYSLTSLTTVGFGDIAPVDAFARNLTMLEAMVGQLFPAIILARILTLYADEHRLGRQHVSTQEVGSENAKHVA